MARYRSEDEVLNDLSKTFEHQRKVERPKRHYTCVKRTILEEALEKALGDADEVQINQAWMQREIGITPQTWYKHIQDLRSKYEIVRGRRGSLLRRRNTTRSEVNGDAQ